MHAHGCRSQPVSRGTKSSSGRSPYCAQRLDFRGAAEVLAWLRMLHSVSQWRLRKTSSLILPVTGTVTAMRYLLLPFTARYMAYSGALRNIGRSPPQPRAIRDTGKQEVSWLWRQSAANRSLPSISLLNRELTGNFKKIGPVGPPVSGQSPTKPGGFCQDSLQSRTGNFFTSNRERKCRNREKLSVCREVQRR